MSIHWAAIFNETEYLYTLMVVTTHKLIKNQSYFLYQYS
uniref:Uncharacterized protein n=1 Tax=Anguilla anguilla TaxID=7936 RepID=A0A0E9U304_ANGAN